jgi:hypothetical protein
MGAAFEPPSGPIPELLLHSAPSSSLEAGEQGNSGAVQFSELVVSQGDAESILGLDGDVTGTLEWSCG